MQYCRCPLLFVYFDESRFAFINKKIPLRIAQRTDKAVLPPQFTEFSRIRPFQALDLSYAPIFNAYPTSQPTSAPHCLFAQCPPLRRFRCAARGCIQPPLPMTRITQTGPPPLRHFSERKKTKTYSSRSMLFGEIFPPLRDNFPFRQNSPLFYLSYHEKSRLSRGGRKDFSAAQHFLSRQFDIFP